jgi:hypothetical protein
MVNHQAMYDAPAKAGLLIGAPASGRRQATYLL